MEIAIFLVFNFFFSEKIIFNFSSEYYLICLMISVFIIWLYRRRIPGFSQKETGILFAFPQRSEYTKKEMENLYNTLKFRIKDGIMPPIKIKILPPNHVPKNEREAHSIRDEADARLIIWGNIEEGGAL
ncbi:MAG: hypothetical protein PHQ06_04965 [Atribacterota bacterium]|nr:hypothetical protein [Atribacterota bacterium]